jgi:hypothetical protein
MIVADARWFLIRPATDWSRPVCGGAYSTSNASAYMYRPFSPWRSYTRAALRGAPPPPNLLVQSSACGTKMPLRLMLSWSVSA